MRSTFLRATLLGSLVLGCGHGARPPTIPVPPSAARPAEGVPPRLVVSVVLDQVGSWVLERHLHLLHPDGAIRTLMARGLWVHRATYAYAGTYTGPGHAAVYTGAPPADSGIVANRRWDRGRARIVGVVDDGAHAEFNSGGHTFVSPAALRADTVADALRASARARGQTTAIAAVSMKDRGAVIPGGLHPDLALWYSEDAHGFTSSTYYGAALPDWVTRWNAANPPAERYAAPWVPLDRAVLQGLGVPDDDAGEGNWRGLGITFPHALATTENPYATFLATPQSAEYLFDMARAVVRELRMGQHTAPDLLMVSVSSTDYVGHVFGPESWEAVDNLVRVDLALGRFLQELDRTTPVAVLVTADHGVMPLVEHSRRQGYPGASRIEFEHVVAAGERAVDAALGPGDWVASFVQPFVYLTPAALEPAVRARAMAAAAQGIAQVPGVAAVYPAAEAAQWRSDPDRVRRAVALSIDPAAAGDLFVVPADHSVVDEKLPQGAGTSHGSPYPLDQEVPVIVAGPGVSHGEVTEPVDFARTAATLAALLGIEAPTHARVDALPGVGVRIQGTARDPR